MQSSFTPGPWEYMESSIVGPKLDDKETWLRPVVARFATGVSLANLNLMLAAPELLEAAIDLKDVCNRPSAARTRAEAWRALDKAIAKATGSEA